MKNSITRRAALKSVAAVGSGVLFGQRMIVAQDPPLQIAGRPVEIALTSVSKANVRITVAPIEDNKPSPVPLDGALVRETFGKPAANLRPFHTLWGPST
jgi:hypothetical protein